MLKGLRTLCMGVTVAFSVASFAQVDLTSRLLNPDAEKGMLGWDVTFVEGGQIWNKQTKGEEKSAGYYGFDNWAFENWRNSAAGLTNSSIFQVVKDLPNGTYVFGAYAMATRDAMTPSIDEILGVSMFANDDVIPVATNRVEGIDAQWGHAIKFNVATVVTDGTLKVGMETKETTASFVAMDNATLYYFGEKSKDEALLEMAKIDIAATIDFVTPFLTAGKMNVDTLANLQAAIEAAQGEITLENATQLNTDLYWGRRLAKKSMAAYESLAAALEAAKEIAGQEWSDYEETLIALEALNALIAACEEKYNDGTALNAEATTWVSELNEAAALVELDAYYLKAEEYSVAIDELPTGDEIGQYSYTDYEKAVALYDEIMFVLYDAGVGDISAITAMAECDKMFAKIQQIIDNPIDYSEFPIFLHRGDTLLPGQGTGDRDKAFKVLDGTYVKNYPAGKYGGNNVATYDSPLFRFRETLTKVRFIVHEVGADFQTAQDGRASFCLSEFSMYDENDEPIELTEENFTTNANEPKEGGGIPALVDGDYSTFMHSLWSGSTPQAHYLEVTLPEGEYSAFRFTMVALTCKHTRAFPAEMEITYVSDLVTELQQTIVAARTNHNPLYGTAPGFYNFDLNPYLTALAEGDAVAEKDGVMDSEVEAAIANVEAAVAEIEEKGIVMPEAGKKYRIISSEPAFVKNQQVHKAWTVHEGDSLRPNWLWWENACADSAKQEFSFEFLEEVDGKLYYAIKSEATGLYLRDWRDADGNRATGYAVFNFAEEPDPYELRNIGAGEWIFVRDGYINSVFHTLDHNSGVVSTTVGNMGGFKGITAPIITWQNAAYDYSGFYIREMMDLPCATKSLSDLTFNSQTYTLYDGVNTLTLTADKESAFEGLAFMSGMGLAITPEEIAVEGNVATVIFTDAIGEFQFSFDNAEGVEEVVVDGSYTYRGVSAAYTALQDKLNAVLALAPIEGTGVGQVTDLSGYNAAIEVADELLAFGAEDAALEAAAARLDKVQDQLYYNLPKEGVDYFILLGLDAIKTNHLTDMGVYAYDNQYLRWSYVSFTNPEYRWQFIDCGELKHGMPAYYLKNVATEQYAGRTIESNNPVNLVADTTSVRPYNIFFLTNGKVALGDTYWANGGQALHPLNHGNGAAANKGGRMITWGKGDAASAMYIVEADEYICDIIHFIIGDDIEEIEVADEQVAVKGIFDLFGRRIETPAATGIYIVDGKKQVVKK